MYSPADLLYSLKLYAGVFSIYCCLVLLFIPAIIAQKNYFVKVFIESKQDTISFANVRDSVQLKARIQQWILENRNEGHFLAGLDSIITSDGIPHVFLHKGRIYHYVFMGNDSLTISDLKALSLNLPDNSNSHPEYWNAQFKKWVNSAADHGFPFARMDISPIINRSDSLYANYIFRKGEKIVFHQSDQRQKKILDDQVLNRIIEIIPGDLYSQKKVEGISAKISRLSYIQLKTDPKVLFLGNEGIVWLYLDKAKASKFDILLGLSPEQGLSDKKYRLTGEAGFEILNSLKIGEKFFLKYENLIENSPRLKLGFDLPYIKFLPFGLSADFFLYRFGEQYINLSSQFQINYSWSQQQYSGLTFSYLNSTVLNPDTLFLLRNHRLPSQLDYNFTAIGLKHEYNSLDYKPNPSKGIHIIFDLKAGLKTFKPNNILLAYETDLIHVQQQYDSLNKNQDQALYSALASWFLQIKPRQVLKFSINTYGILGSGRLLDNELFRIGGYKNLRGFDEDFFICSHAAIQTIEYRFLLDRNSFIQLFSDFAYLNQPIQNGYQWNWYEGFGLGIQFQTKVGAFSLQYALGVSKFQSVDIGKGKIHFGYTTLF